MGMGRKPAPNRGCIATRGHRITLTLEAQISRLRRKLREAGAQVDITTLPGIGYMLKATEPAL